MNPQEYAELTVPAASFKRLVQRDHTYRTFASDVEHTLRRQRRGRASDPSRPQTCSHALISQLANGLTKNTHPDRADAIERVLGREREIFALRFSNQRPE